MLPRKLSRRRLFCEPLESRQLLSITPVVVDLLAVYTPAAATQVGGDTHMIALIQESVDSANQALINTNLSITIRLVHAEPISYTSSGDVYTDRVRLETPGDGYMDSIFALRNTYGADIVTLISDGEGGGNADLMTGISDPNNPNLAFSAVFADSMGPGYLTLAHEIGHNLGAGHERNNPNPGENVVGPFPYSYGYRFPVNDPGVITASFNDIMSYAYGNDIPIFQYSNPNILLDGTPTGLPPSDPNSADLYDTFLQTAPIVAAYRPTVVPDTTAPTAKLFEIDRSDSSLTFTIRYTDDTGIDLSTIGSGDITVTGPGGFALPATFVSMDHPTISGAYKFATYHVTLPATNPSTDSLSFNLLPNAVTDIYAHPAASGVIAQHTAYYAGSPFEASGTYAAYTWADPLSSNLTPGSTFTEYGSLGPDDLAHYYSFTLTQTSTIEVSLAGFSADCNMYITSDANHDGLDDDTNLTPNSGFNSGTTPEDVGLTLPAGTYYIHVDQPTPVQTPYTLTLRAAVADTTPPTAILDATDLKTDGATDIYFAVTYTDDNLVNDNSVQYASVDINITLDRGYSFSYYPLYPDPSLNQSFADASSKTIYYHLNNSSGYTSGDNGTYTVSIHNDGTDPLPQDDAGNSLTSLALASFKISIGSPDTTPPTAILSATPPVPGQTLWTFTVLYKDNAALNTSSLTSSNLRVTGPNSYSQLATFVSVTPLTNIQDSYLATYTAPAPGGFWDNSDAGAYTIAVQSNQVKDSAGNFAPAASFSPVSFSSPYLTATTGPTSVSFIGTSSADTMRLDADANFVYFTLNDSILYYLPKSAVPRFTLSSLAGNDSLFFQSGTLTGSISPGTGTDSLAITGGALTLDTDTTAATPLDVSLANAASLTLTSTQHFNSLSLSGTSHAAFTAGANKVLVTKSLTFAGTSSLNLADNSLILDYTGSSPLTTLRAYLQTGYAAGAWTGPGIDSSSAASSPNRAIAYAEASSLGVTTFAGQTVDSTALLLKYTYAGDANLDGKITPDDYTLADRGLAKHLNTWIAGDFNYDGSVTSADLKLLEQSDAATAPATVIVPPPAPPLVESAPEVIPAAAIIPASTTYQAKPKITAKKGKTVTVAVKVTNLTKKSANSTAKLRIYFSSNGILDVKDSLILTKAVSLKLKSKASTVFNITVKIPPSMVGKSWHILATALPVPKKTVTVR
jgi:hypothetical protein